jgi:hypothetical protein
MRAALGLSILLGAAAPAEAGEAFTYRFSLGPVIGARARLAIGAPEAKGGRRVLGAQAQAEAAPWLKGLVPFDNRYEVVLDADRLVPLRVLGVEHGLRERRSETTVEDGVTRVVVTSPKGGFTRARRLPPDVRDPLSALLALRKAPLAQGETHEQLLLDEVLWKVTVEVHRGERIVLETEGEEAPAHRAIRVEGKLERTDEAGRVLGTKTHHFTLWLSDDARRVPLRIASDSDLGRCTLELTSYLPDGAAPGPIRRAQGPDDPALPL